MRRCRHGYFVYNRNDAFIGQSLDFYGEYSEGEVDLFRLICGRGDTAVDVGANIGALTVPLSLIVGNKGKVFAFEAQRVIFQALCANVAVNSISNTVCENVGAAESSGGAYIPAVDYCKAGNFGGVSIGSGVSEEAIDLERLDALLDGEARIDFIKIDVEGMEEGVICGANSILNNFKPVLYVENDRIDKSTELIELIRSLGYRLYWHTPPLYNPNNYYGERINIYKNIVSVNMLCLPDGYENKRLEGFEGLTEVGDSDSHPFKE